MKIPPRLDKECLKQLEEELLAIDPSAVARWVINMAPTVGEIFRNINNTWEQHVAFGMLLGCMYTKRQVDLYILSKSKGESHDDSRGRDN